ncbi:MAG: DNA polymerase III subunit delta' [Burkholderiales bacterium]|nr:DNA polymerase III subunit delta' [Burkholderiales bacterium]MBS0413460.1 DNA polymerase III subunit delta' [Pseudomonadota bacterium]
MAPWIARQLQALLAQRGHAWLLQGPSGLGQFDLALSLVRTWLCDAPTLPAARGSLPPEGALAALGRPGGGSDAPTPLGACGACPSCHGIDVHTHPDLVVLMPETEMLARGWPLPEKAQAEIDDKKRKPSKDIRVDAMREAIDFAQRTSGRGRGKALLVYPAERMNAVTANALLKTLEEPPGDARFVLASDAAHLLLPTIRSRCQAHTLAWPAEPEALAWLAEQGVAAALAPGLLRAAGGRPAAALALAGEADGARAWAELPRALGRGDVAALAGVPVPEAVARLQKLCHDLLARQVGAPPRFFDAADLPARALSQAALTRWWKQLAESARSAEHPLNPGLVTEFLVNAARQALNSKL